MTVIARVILLTLLSGPALALACGCSNPRSVQDVREGSMVFEGRVLKVTKDPGSGKGLHLTESGTFSIDVPTQEVLWEVTRVLVGPHAETMRVLFNEGGTTSCDLEELDFAVGQRYRLSVRYDPSDVERGSFTSESRFSNNFCNLMERI